jgi:hypothetical protein
LDGRLSRSVPLPSLTGLVYAEQPNCFNQEITNMALPKTIQQSCDLLAASLTTTPFLAPTPHQRRAIYTAIGNGDDLIARRIRAWLAIFAAQRALPVFQAWFPADDLPLQLVTTALRAVTGDVDEQTIRQMAEWGYHAAGNSWGYAEEDLPLAVDYAGQAAYYALGSTTHDLYFLQDIDTKYHTMTATGMRRISGAEWTNQRLINFPPASDVALYAAAAHTLDADDVARNADAWYAFWMWWLTEAIPAAWEQGSG